MRKVWQGIKQIINVKSKQSDIPTSITVNNSLITNPTDISNSFNNYYSGIAENILKERKYEGYQDGYGNFMTYMPPPEPNSIAFHPVDGDDVYYIINSFDEKKKTGPNSIPPKILKLISVEISLQCF